MTIDFEKKFSQKASQDPFSQSLSEEQFSQVLSAIIEGKYSWACALFLKFSGHDPRNYLPYRTYIRLIKERCQRNDTNTRLKDNASNTLSGSSGIKKSRQQIVDLNHLEQLDDIGSGIIGGYQCLQCWENATDGDTAEMGFSIGLPAFS